MGEEAEMPAYSPAEQARQRAAMSPATQWRREAEIWFDGTPESVDRRLAACDRLLATSHEIVAHDGVGPVTRRHLATIEDLTAQRRVLAELRHDLITGATDREEESEPPNWDARAPEDRWERPDSDVHKMPNYQKDGHLVSRDRRYVELESAKFLAANSECPVDELAIRARHHAEVETSTFTGQRSRAVTAGFVQKVTQLRRAAPRPRVASAPARSLDSFPPELIFM